MIPTQEVVSIPLAAAELKMSSKKLRKLISRYEIPTLRLGPRRTYVARKDLKRFTAAPPLPQIDLRNPDVKALVAALRDTLSKLESK